MSAPSVLIAGCGDVGSRLATQLLAAGWEVHGLRRDISRLPDGVIGVAGDLFKEDCPATWPVGAVDYLVYCAAATDHDEAGYRAAYVQGLQNVLSWLGDYGQVPERLLFVSSSSVYGQQNGEWVDEHSAPCDRLFRASDARSRASGAQQRHPGQRRAPDRYLRPGP
jgi:nucleoside-diphosphate-sugar epimerase